ncbi:unnamed protein product [Meloidogyne enterolobii]|uniref:Uncharacterized protein n=1 Tax=Meloidogyne enterolobii TaxID=390850 RepID=A0ACB0ZKH1_MELEN
MSRLTMDSSSRQLTLDSSNLLTFSGQSDRIIVLEDKKGESFEVEGEPPIADKKGESFLDVVAATSIEDTLNPNCETLKTLPEDPACPKSYNYVII